MATLAANAIRIAIRECLTGVLGGTRAPALGYASDDLFAGASDYTRAMRAVIKPTFDIRVTAIPRQEDTPNEVSNIRLYKPAIVVKTTYKLIDEANFVKDYEAVKAQAERDVDVFTRALGFPGSVYQTSPSTGSQLTGIVSGLLRNTGSNVVNEDPDSGLYEIEMTFDAIALVDVNAA